MKGFRQKREAAKPAYKFPERSRSKEASWMVKSPGLGRFPVTKGER
jgi:hypothetical protein